MTINLPGSTFHHSHHIHFSPSLHYHHLPLPLLPQHQHHQSSYPLLLPSPKTPNQSSRSHIQPFPSIPFHSLPIHHCCYHSSSSSLLLPLLHPPSSCYYYNDQVTQSRSGDAAHKTIAIHTNNYTMELVDNLLTRTSEMMDPHAANVVAYSGGVDSSLVAALVYRAFSEYNTKLLRQSTDTNGNTIISNTNHGSVQAVLGISPAVPQSQISVARTVAEQIGIPLTEVTTTEGSDETYQRNDGYACYVCKTHLYSTLETVANEVMKQQQQQQLEQQQRMVHDNGQFQQDSHAVILYNGTNADDTQDPTRLGLIAASNFQVHSPLDQITKDQVRRAAKYLGLPNWNAAASPCLRSRLAMGVTATEKHLKAVELAEEFVRSELQLDETVNARVRMLAGGKAMVELDDSIILQSSNDSSSRREGGENWAASVLRERGFDIKCIEDWGFNSFGGVRGFKTGSVAAMPKEDDGVLERQSRTSSSSS